MTAVEQVRGVRRRLALGLATIALLQGGAMAVLVLAGAGLVDLATALPLEVRRLALVAAGGVGLAGVTTALIRGRAVRSLESVALWIEERHPSLRYVLVTAVDSCYRHLSSRFETALAGMAWRTRVRRSIMRGGVRPAALLLAGLLVLALLPRGVVGRVTTPRPGDVLEAARPAGVHRLGAIVIRVRPPRYTRLAEQVLESPTAVSAVVGSQVDVEGRGAAVGLAVRVGDRALRVEGDGREWSVRFAMPEAAAPLRIAADSAERIIVLEPRPDSAPAVTLSAPARDTVLRLGVGTLPVVADARDDFGLARLRLEIIVSEGQGEDYAFSSGVLAERPVRDRQGRLDGRLNLDSLQLPPGAFVHVRAVAFDANDVTGPGVGVSETRTIRVARLGEFDSLAVVALPPVSGDTSLLSQRLLVMMAEALVAQRDRLERDAFVSESRSIGRDQTRLRRSIAEIIFMRIGGEEGEHGHGEAEDEEGADLDPQRLLQAAEAAVEGAAGEALDFHGDETPVVAVNRPLLDAYNAMWDASRELNIGAPDSALPHMYAALEAIQRARAAERIYLRGRAPDAVIDVAGVRLAGDRNDALPAARQASRPLEARAALTLRLSGMLPRLLGGHEGMVDSLVLLRIEALSPAPAAAAALGEAIAAIRSGDDPRPALARARALMSGAESRRSSLGRWDVP